MTVSRMICLRRALERDWEAMCGLKVADAVVEELATDHDGRDISTPRTHGTSEQCHLYTALDIPRNNKALGVKLGGNQRAKSSTS